MYKMKFNFMKNELKESERFLTARQKYHAI